MATQSARQGLGVGAGPLTIAAVVVASLGLSAGAGAWRAVAADAGVATMSAAIAAPQRIAMDGTRFTPHDVTVPLGTTVSWTNADPFPHDVEAAGAFRSGDLAPGATWSVTPSRRGVFEYRCTRHPGMNAVLRVD